MSTKEFKYQLFDKAYFFDHTADYMLSVGNNEKMREMSYKFDAVMSVIESLNLVSEYETFVATGVISD